MLFIHYTVSVSQVVHEETKKKFFFKEILQFLLVMEDGEEGYWSLPSCFSQSPSNDVVISACVETRVPLFVVSIS
jgi:hypothetical protein